MVLRELFFRNTRKVMDNFAVRCPRPVELDGALADFEAAEAKAILEEVDKDLFEEPAKNIKVEWLCELLKEKSEEKFLPHLLDSRKSRGYRERHSRTHGSENGSFS